MGDHDGAYNPLVATIDHLNTRLNGRSEPEHDKTVLACMQCNKMRNVAEQKGCTIDVSLNERGNPVYKEKPCLKLRTKALAHTRARQVHDAINATTKSLDRIKRLRGIGADDHEIARTLGIPIDSPLLHHCG